MYRTLPVLALALLSPAYAALPPLAPPPTQNKAPGDAAVVVGTVYAKLASDGTFTNDAQAWRRLLRDTVGVPDERISVLGQPDPAHLLAAVQRQGELATETLWVVFEGHGAGDLLITWGANDDQESIASSHSVSRQALLDQAAASGAKRVVVVLDACRSGKDRSGQAIHGARFLINKKHREKVPAKVTLWSATRDQQFAHSLAEVKHGLFSYYAIRALSGEAGAGGEVHLERAQAWVTDQLVAELRNRPEHQQSPELVKGHDPPVIRVPDCPGCGPRAAVAERTPPITLPIAGGLSEYEAAQAARIAAEERERKALEQAKAELAAVAEREWQTFERIEARGGPEVEPALAALERTYGQHPLGNPLGERLTQARLRLQGRATPLHPEAATRVRPATVLVPSGRFTQGSPPDEPGRDRDEGPTRHVTIRRPFLMMSTEVTQGQWQALMKNNPSYFTSCGSDCPVERVSWHDAVAYANALSKAEGFTECYHLTEVNGHPGGGCEDEPVCEGDHRHVAALVPGCTGWRLPTEAEWEYAARGGTQTAVYAGPMVLVGKSTAPVLEAIAWYRANSKVGYDGRAADCSGTPDGLDWDPGHDRCGPRAVGRKQPNAFGLYDMLGNVWEWCQDGYRAGAYGGGTTSDPLEASGSGRVVRGGSWNYGAARVRAAFRNGVGPAFRKADRGFRLVRPSP